MVVSGASHGMAAPAGAAHAGAACATARATAITMSINDSSVDVSCLKDPRSLEQRIHLITTPFCELDFAKPKSVGALVAFHANDLRDPSPRRCPLDRDDEIDRLCDELWL